VTLDDGSAFWGFEVSEEETEDIWTNGNNIERSIPGSPTIVDIDRDGYDDCVYVGDLEGRMWKVHISPQWHENNSWQAEKIYEDSRHYPIVTKPAVWLNAFSSGIVPRVYFGTGGDDSAPADATYSFIALLDNPNHEVEWFLGDPGILELPEEKNRGDLSEGEKVWADPKIGDFTVYFSTLTGSIESVDPCENLAGLGRLYARSILSLNGAHSGSTVLTSSFGRQESLNLAIKTRSAVTFGETGLNQGGRKGEIYIQEYDSTIQRLEQLVGSNLIIKSWREVYRVIR
jgi:Tfp pilus tip-associated adhesin PilY1